MLQSINDWPMVGPRAAALRARLPTVRVGTVGPNIHDDTVSDADAGEEPCSKDTPKSRQW